MIVNFRMWHRWEWMLRGRSSCALIIFIFIGNTVYDSEFSNVTLMRMNELLRGRSARTTGRDTNRSDDDSSTFVLSPSGLQALSQTTLHYDDWLGREKLILFSILSSGIVTTSSTIENRNSQRYKYIQQSTCGEITLFIQKNAPIKRLHMKWTMNRQHIILFNRKKRSQEGYGTEMFDSVCLSNVNEKRKTRKWNSLWRRRLKIWSWLSSLHPLHLQWVHSFVFQHHQLRCEITQQFAS